MLPETFLNQQLFNSELEAVDLGLELTALVGGDAGSNHGASHAAGTAKGGLGRDKDVGHVLRENKQQVER